MYITSQIKIEELLLQIGLSINPYEISLRNERNADRSKIKYVNIQSYGMKNRMIATSMISHFNEDMTTGKFHTSFVINTTAKDSQYPFGLNVLKNDQEIMDQFTKTEDYIKLLHVLSNKVLKTVYVDIVSEISFPDNKPVIKNPKQQIRPLMFNDSLKDNKKDLTAYEYIEEKFSEHGIFYEHEKMSEIVTAFEMLVI